MDKNKSKADSLIDEYKNSLGDRQNFEGYWQSLHDYFYIESSNVNEDRSQGTELKSEFLWDPTSIDCSDVLANGFMSYLTPPTSKWGRVVHSDIRKREDKEIMSYFEDVTDEVHYTLNNSNFYAQMQPLYKSSGVYGTSIMLEEEDIDDVVSFYNMPIKQCIVIDDARQRPVKYYIEFEYTAQQAADKWGIDNLSRELKEDLKSEKRNTKKHKFLLHIAKRSQRDVRKTDKANMPIAAIWIDLEGRYIIDEGGYNEMPAFCHRFDKRPFTVWGFSPAMKALPFARMLNAYAKTNLRAMMKGTDPAMALPNNAFVLPFNQNPRAMNYYDPTKLKNGANDVFPLGNFGRPDIGMTAIEYYAKAVESIMYKDVFLAFNQITKQMNNPEIAERIAEKMTMLGPAVGRYIKEINTPVFERTIGILARRGRLPPLPDALRDDPRYQIDTVSQLSQAQKRSELNALLTSLQLVGQVAQFDPSVIDNISGDKVVKEAWSIVGAPNQVLRSDDEIQAMREARAQVAEQQQQMNIAQQGADVVEKGSKADLNISKAGGGA